MKRFLLILLFAFPLATSAQSLVFPMSDSTNKVAYKGDIKVDSSTTKVELHYRLKEWIQVNFLAENKVLHRDDLKEGIIVAKAFAGYKTKLNASEFYNKLTWTMILKFGNGRCNFEMTDFYSSENAAGNNAYTASWVTPIEDLVLKDIAFKENGEYKPMYKMHAVALEKSVREVIESLKKYISPAEISSIEIRAAQLNSELNKTVAKESSLPSSQPAQKTVTATINANTAINQPKAAAETLSADNSLTVQPVTTVKQEPKPAATEKPEVATKTMDDLKKMQDNVKKLELELKLQKDIDELNAEIKELEAKKAQLKSESVPANDSPKTMEDLKKMQENIKKLEAELKIQKEIDKLKEEVKTLENKKAELNLTAKN
ncbi:DUF4468 domain-containing protein [Solitalea lacus]|uniref:DUF4468 domain-containing protein n=1 Tax=Solitalea lacus TaxID=2911172 RepID=UPI001EDA0385|nr:DUF4468 domain-containing protein [Solitalea lacus]UKJ09012.1 DUF4468 domain-containing protein [Solitalea lacus]